MCRTKLAEEEIFFGTIDQKGKKDSLIPRQPSIQELEKIWESAPEAFLAKCDCGARMYAYSQFLKLNNISKNTVESNTVRFFCPTCGTRKEVGGNLFKGQERIAILTRLIQK